ncbi:unnamed protein product [Mycena citricolor]|uniref:PARP catalytic domain-containing protein n=1 Tax=Mycena citricolor TaxID=2018698 RepID=A0AAD2H699_9AGAR|nr:unnamed protein product [Mycena citricolor]
MRGSINVGWVCRPGASSVPLQHVFRLFKLRCSLDSRNKTQHCPASLHQTMPSILHWGTRQQKTISVVPAMDLCDQCGQKPKFLELGGAQHPYCSRSCAKKAQATTQPESSNTQYLTACVLRGCRATGKSAFANFCSDEHGKQGVQMGQAEACDMCQVSPRAIGDLCLPCERKYPGPRLREVSPSATSFRDVRAQFLSEWDNPSGTKPKVEKVYQISVPRDIKARHESFRRTQHPTTEIRLFHSSQCICDLGTKGPALCSFRSCGICSIVKSSFHEFAFGEKANCGRFGDGVYAFRNPSLADGHSTSATSTPYRVMIACDAAVASNAEIPDDLSVFIPRAEAILPAYVIIYTV